MLKMLSTAVVQPRLDIRLLGNPQVHVSGAPVPFATRKALALFIHAAARAPQAETRLRLCDLLWGDTQPEKAAASLRKAISIVTKCPELDEAIHRGRNELAFQGEVNSIDLHRFWRHLAVGTPSAHREARALWTGPPLQDFSIGMPEYDDWVTMFRAGVVDEAVRMLTGQLAAMRAKPSSGDELVPLCELIVRIEPAEAVANETLIEVFRDNNDSASLNRQVQSYARALDELDLELPSMLRRRAPALLPASAPAPVKSAVTRQPDGRPSVSIVAPGGPGSAPPPVTFAYAELLSQLTRFRTLRCVEAGVNCDDGPASGCASSGDYRIIIWNEPTARSVFIKCLNARRRSTIAVRKLPHSVLNEPDKAGLVIGATINALEEAISSDEAVFESNAFARWLQAYRHIGAFTPHSDNHATAILRGLMHDRQGQRLSLVYSSISHVAMRRRYAEPDATLCQATATNALAAIDHALALDPIEPYNHIVRGWLVLHTNTSKVGLASFEDALDLNPYSGKTMIATAAANAVCGNLVRAEELATRASAVIGRNTDPYHHGLLAGVRYLTGDPLSTLNHLQRGPRNLMMALYGICANHDLGHYDEAAGAYQHLEMRLLETMGSRSFGNIELEPWIRHAGLSRDPEKQDQMIDIVRHYRDKANA